MKYVAAITMTKECFDRNFAFTEKPVLFYEKGNVLTSSNSCRRHCLFLIFCGYTGTWHNLKMVPVVIQPTL